MTAPKRLSARFIITFALISGIIVVAVGAAAALIARREPPAQTLPPEPVLNVEVARMEPEDVSIQILGYGEVRPIETVPITPQVSGAVVETHDRLHVGEVIPAGETLFKIDPRDYRAAATQARAQALSAASALARLRTQQAADRERLETLARSRDLARNEHDRVKALFEQEQVGALSGVERAELTYNQARDAYDLLHQNVELYPSRIAEAEQGAAAAEAGLALAETNLERTVIIAPFDARIKEKRIEQGQFVGPGAPVLTLANDAVLEIAAPLDSRDARMGLRFREADSDASSSWFDLVEQTPCRITWTEDPERHAWPGVLHRIVDFDETTRTVTVAVRTTAAEARAVEAGLPLVEGMFCQIEIPGRTMHQVYRLPRTCVTFENQVYLAQEGRLHPRSVTVLRTQHGQAFIQDGLAPGDLAIITRLATPLPGAKIHYEEETVVPSAALAPFAATSAETSAEETSS